MLVSLGAPVIGSGGDRLGEVEGVVVDAGTKRARVILVDRGMLSRGRHMVGVSAITGSDAEGQARPAAGHRRNQLRRRAR